MKWIFFLLIFIIVIGGVIFYFYKYHEQPSQKILMDEINISIGAFDEKDNFVKTSYKISYEGLTRYQNTSDRAYVQERAIYNKSVFISNVNIDTQKYYIEENEILLNQGSRIKRLDINLIEGIPPTISQSNPITSSEQSLNLLIEGKGEYRNPGFCIDYSVHFIYFKVIGNLIEIDRPLYLNSFYRCYSLGIEKLESGQIISIPIVYKVFDSLKSQDYVEVIVFDDETFYKKYNFQSFRILQNEGDMVLNVRANNLYKNPYVCIGYSDVFTDFQINKNINDINILISEKDTFGVIEFNKLKYLKSPYKCYNLGIEKIDKNQVINLPIYYKISKQLKNEDYINVILFDNDVFSNELKIIKNTGGDDINSTLNII